MPASMPGRSLLRQRTGHPLANPVFNPAINARAANEATKTIERLTKMSASNGLSINTVTGNPQIAVTLPRVNVLHGRADGAIPAAIASDRPGKGKVQFQRRNPSTNQLYDLDYGYDIYNYFTQGIVDGAEILAIQIFDEWEVLQVYDCGSLASS